MAEKSIQKPVHGDICFLLVFPISTDKKLVAANMHHQLNRAPYFRPVDVDIQMLEASAVQLEGVHISQQPHLFDDAVQVVECRFALENPLSETANQLVFRLKELLTQLWVPAHVLESEMWESYSLLLFDTAVPSVDRFISDNAAELAGFIRTQKERLSQSEIENTLISRLNYAQDDVTIVDWEGAIIVSPTADFQSDIEVIKVAVYQLLRYRMVDKRIDEKLTFIRDEVLRKKSRRSLTAVLPIQSRRTLQQIVQERLTLLLDFERIDQELLMIGDWYTAQLYRTAIDELYLDEWKQNVQRKLENLESIVQAVQDNFNVSWSHILDMIQLVGWLLLLLGYFYLFYLDTVAYNIIP
jgi:hypothetical protein